VASLSAYSPKRFWKFCITRCSMVGEIAVTSSLMFCFKSTVVHGFFSYTLLLRYPQRKKYCDYGHWFWWILKCWRNINWVKTESLFLKYVSTAKTRCSTDQRSMATEMLWVSLEVWSRTNSPRQSFHSQPCYQIIRYFCWTLYLATTQIHCPVSPLNDPAGSVFTPRLLSFESSISLSRPE